VIALVSAVFAASLLGSLHCAGMCGGFLAFAVGLNEPTRGQRFRLHAAYHLGRLSTYTALGALAGGVGAAVDLGGASVGMQRTAAVLAGSLMVVFGAVALMAHAGVRLPRAPVPRFLRNLVASGHRAAFAMPPDARALVVGMLTTLLPCGWLYAFAVVAAGTARPELGALTMAVFWAGTLPVMVSLGAGLAALTGRLRRRVPILTSAALIVVGTRTAVERLALPSFAGATPPSSSARDAALGLRSGEVLPPCHREHCEPGGGR
jgi:uncharacterized protein